MRRYRGHLGWGWTMGLRCVLRWCEGERGQRWDACENHLLRQGWLAYAIELGVPVADLLHARLELVHTLSDKSKESLELLDADVEYRGSLLERISLPEDALSLLWSNFVGQYIPLSERERRATHDRNSHLEGPSTLRSTNPVHEQTKS